jgi:PAS domain S-box-containing protein
VIPVSEDEQPGRENASEIARLRERLREAEDTLRAISLGEVDAFVVTGESDARVYTIDGADQAYRTIIETMHEGAVTIGEDGTVLYCNSLFATIVDEPMASVIGSSFFRFLSSPEQKSDFLRLPQLQANGGVRGEFELRSGSGKPVEVYLAVAPMDLADSRVLFAVVTDLREQERIDRERARELERQVAERTSELRRFKYLADSSFEAINVLDGDLRLVYANTAFYRLLGYDEGELLGQQSYESMLSGKQVGSFPAELSEALENTAEWNGEIEMTRKDGSTLPALVSVSVMLDDQGQAIGRVLMFRDISDRKKTEEDLRRANEGLDAYARTVSHDLRSPLSAVIMANELLRDVLDDKDEILRSEIDEETALIGRSTSKAYKLINDLLLLAEAGQQPVNITEVDIRGVVHKVVEEYAHQVASHGVKLQIDPDLGTIRANETQMYQVFGNLISNAILHNDSPEPVVAIRRLDDKAGAHRFQVCDNSSGIPEQVIDEIFTPFVRSGKSRSSGIGLAIVRKVVSAYGGDVRAYNNGGACFELSLRDIKTEP